MGVKIREDRSSYDRRIGGVQLVVMSNRDVNDRYGRMSAFVNVRSGLSVAWHLSATGQEITSRVGASLNPFLTMAISRIRRAAGVFVAAMCSVTGIHASLKKRDRPADSKLRKAAATRNRIWTKFSAWKMTTERRYVLRSRIPQLNISQFASPPCKVGFTAASLPHCLMRLRAQSNLSRLINH